MASGLRVGGYGPGSKRSALYAWLGQVDNKGTGTITIAGGPAVTAANFGGKKSTGYEAGLRHNF